MVVLNVRCVIVAVRDVRVREWTIVRCVRMGVRLLVMGYVWRRGIVLFRNFIRKLWGTACHVLPIVNHAQTQRNAKYVYHHITKQNNNNADYHAHKAPTYPCLHQTQASNNVCLAQPSASYAPAPPNAQNACQATPSISHPHPAKQTATDNPVTSQTPKQTPAKNAQTNVSNVTMMLTNVYNVILVTI